MTHGPLPQARLHPTTQPQVPASVRDVSTCCQPAYPRWHRWTIRAIRNPVNQARQTETSGPWHAEPQPFACFCRKFQFGPDPRSLSWPNAKGAVRPCLWTVAIIRGCHQHRPRNASQNGIRLGRDIRSESRDHPAWSGWFSSGRGVERAAVAGGQGMAASCEAITSTSSYEPAAACSDRVGASLSP